MGHYRDDADPVAAGRQAAILVLGWIMTARVFDQDDAADHKAWAGSVAGMLSRALSW